MRNILFATLLTFLMTACYHSTGVEPPVSIITKVEDSNNADFIRESPKAMAANGDFYISNNNFEIVVDGGILGERRQSFLAPTGGSIIDVSNITVNSLLQRNSYLNDNLNQIFQVVNANLGTPVAYTSIRIETLTDELSNIRLVGGVMDRDGSLQAAGASVDPATGLVNGVVVETVYTVERSSTYLEMSTIVTNNGAVTVPIFTVGDYVFMGGNSLRSFIPAPAYGYAPRGSADTLVYAPFVTFEEHIAPYQTLGFFAPDDGVLALTFDSSDVDYERSGGTFVTMSKPATDATTLPAGEAVTFVRRMIPSLSNNQEVVAGNIINTLQYTSDDPRNIFQEMGFLTGVLSHRASNDDLIIMAEQIVPGTYYNGREMVSSPIPIPILASRLVDVSSFSFNVPAGQYQLRVFGHDIDDYLITTYTETDEGDPDVEGDETSTQLPLSVEQGKNLATGTIELMTDPVSSVQALVKDADGNISRGRAAIFPTDGGNPVMLGDRENGESGVLNNAMLYHGDRNVLLPVGDYRMVMSNGPLYEAVEVTVSIVQEEDEESGNTNVVVTPETVEATLTRQVDPGAYRSFDPVVRTYGSYNCSVTSTDRVIAALCENLDVMMVSDINTNRDPETDLLSILESRYERESGNGISIDRNLLHILNGTTIKTLSPKAELARGFGEFVVFPMEHEVGVKGFGAGETGDRRFATVLDNIRNRQQDITKYAMLRRPRGTYALPNGIVDGLFTSLNEAVPVDFDNSYFSQVSELGTGTTNNAFELIEVLSGNHYDEYLATRMDWFHGLTEGVLKWAAGGSGFTWNAPQFVGSPRTWVYSPEETFAEDTFLAAFAAGQSFISTGPILDVTVGDNVPGATIAASGGQVTVNINIRAAEWIPVEELRIIVDGVVVHQESLAAATGVNRFSGSITVDVPEYDSFVLVECGASLENIAAGAFPGDRYAEVYPGVQPLAFTNPFLVDRDGDGSWQ